LGLADDGNVDGNELSYDTKEMSDYAQSLSNMSDGVDMGEFSDQEESGSVTNEEIGIGASNLDMTREQLIVLDQDNE